MRKGAQKGKSHSKRPVNPSVPQWVKLTPDEVENIITGLAKKGLSKPMIGQTLRDEYGVPLSRSLLGKTVSQVMTERGIERRVPDDLQALIDHSNQTAKHLEQHPADRASLRGLEITESKIHRLSKYYRRVGVLPKDWKYAPKAATFS
jgi:small subunit ribosomal protein S15